MCEKILQGKQGGWKILAATEKGERMVGKRARGKCVNIKIKIKILFL